MEVVYLSLCRTGRGLKTKSGQVERRVVCALCTVCQRALCLPFVLCPVETEQELRAVLFSALIGPVRPLNLMLFVFEALTWLPVSIFL